jgi:hypothetical protein
MYYEFKLCRDDGELVIALYGDATQPIRHRLPLDISIVEGNIRFYGFWYSPSVIVDAAPPSVPIVEAGAVRRRRLIRGFRKTRSTRSTR